MFKTSTLRLFTFSVGVVAVLAAVSLSGPGWALGSTPVTVVNPADIAKAEGIQQPYQAPLDCEFNGFTCDAQIQAPPTQRLVIEFVSATCALTASNQIVDVTLNTVVGGLSVSHYLIAQPPQGSSSSISQQVRIYADPSSTIEFFFRTSEGNSGKFCLISMSGQAVTVP